MKERPILFTAPMVRAVLAGTKTQTRRILAPPWRRRVFDGVPYWGFKHATVWDNGVWHTWDNRGITVGSDQFSPPEQAKSEAAHIAARQGFWKCPYGVSGDRLWVRETWAPMPAGVLSDGLTGRYVYRADPDVFSHTCESDFERWRPSIHMPRDASRITLEITDVRVERLQGISEADARAEGVEFDGENFKEYIGGKMNVATAWGSFYTLWTSINGPGSWDKNPWVWVVGFKRVEV